MTIIHIAILGNPVDGLRFYGPFDDMAEAHEWAEAQHEDWWVTELQSAKPDDAYPPKFVVIDEGSDLDDPVVVGPFLYEPDAITWAASGNDRQVTQLWTPEQYTNNEHQEVTP